MTMECHTRDGKQALDMCSLGHGAAEACAKVHGLSRKHVQVAGVEIGDTPAPGLVQMPLCSRCLAVREMASSPASDEPPSRATCHAAEQSDLHVN